MANIWGTSCLGITYSRFRFYDLYETITHQLDELQSIMSVIRDFQFFVCEKWEIASDSSGSGNTANIGKVTKISDILTGNGVFKHLSEAWFDDYWMNYGKITITVDDGEQSRTRCITKLKDFLT